MSFALTDDYSPAKTAAKATASTKAKDAEILELQKQLSDYRQTITQMEERFEKLEIKQRLLG